MKGFRDTAAISWFRGDRLDLEPVVVNHQVCLAREQSVVDAIADEPVQQRLAGGFIRYCIAVVVACIVTGAGFGLAKHFRDSFIENFRQQLRTAKAEGKLPKELENVDLDSFSPEGWEIRLTEKDERRLKIADWLRYGWHIWVPAVFLASIAAAYFTARRAPH